jgi:translation initiation factor IF-3
MQHPELGQRILDRVAEAVSHLGRVEVFPKLDGRNMIMVLAPDKRAKAAWEKAKAEADGGSRSANETDTTNETDNGSSIDGAAEVEAGGDAA